MGPMYCIFDAYSKGLGGSNSTYTIEWVYLVLEVIGDSIMAYGFKIYSTSSKLKRVEFQLVHLTFFDVSRILICKGFKGHYEMIHLKSLVDFGVPNAMGEGPIIST
jgi:hypothetical protein